ncbi:hypothetical protein Tco_0879118 [Tanacetum coccineum]
MAKSSSQNPSSPNLTPKEEHVTLDKPNSHNLFLPADQYTRKEQENSKIWVSTPTGGIISEIGITTFRNAIGAGYSDTYVDSPSFAIVRPWFAEIGYNGEIGVKGTLKKCCLPPSREATKGGSSRAPTGSKTSHSHKSKESGSAMDSNPSQPSFSTLVDTEMQKEDQ